MTWVKFDDQFNMHPKVCSTDPLAQLLHMKSLIYCGQYLTDGFISRGAVAGVLAWDLAEDWFEAGPPLNHKLAGKLVEAGLWKAVTKPIPGWQIHDYLDWNPSKAQVLQERERSNKRLKRHRKLKEEEKTKRLRNTGPVPVPEGDVVRPPLPGPVPVPEPELKNIGQQADLTPSEDSGGAALVRAASGISTGPSEKNPDDGRYNKDIRSVFDAYRVHHPRSHKNPTADSKAWRLIKARLNEGYTVSDLTLAVDGCHKSNFHNGMNDRGKRYQKLELIMREGGMVDQFMEMNEPSAAEHMSTKEQKTMLAIKTVIEKRKQHGA